MVAGVLVTWYLLHIIIGLGAVVAFGFVQTRPLWIALATTAASFVTAAAFSWAWARRFKLGPLEWLMRRVTAS